MDIADKGTERKVSVRKIHTVQYMLVKYRAANVIKLRMCQRTQTIDM